MAIAVLLKNFCRLDNEILPVQFDVMTPLDFAYACLEIADHTKHLLADRFISTFWNTELEALDKGSNLAIPEFEKLEPLLLDDKRFRREPAKNLPLLEYIKQKRAPLEFHPEYAVDFCRRERKNVKAAVRTLFPNVGKFAPEKTPFRIRQKYTDEYCPQYLQAGIHAYKKFKDLFRCSITFEAFCEDFGKLSNEAVPLSSSKVRKEGNYKAAYLILNIEGLNVEMKIVRNLEASLLSHDWYEVKRNPSRDNLTEFIRSKLRQASAAVEIEA